MAGAAIALMVVGALVTEIGLERTTRQQRRTERREVDLLNRATRVASGPGWSEAAVRGSLVYHWTTPHEVLRLDGLWGRRRSSAPARIVRRNLVNGRETGETVPFARRARLLSSSPNGRWLLWSTTGANEVALLAVGRGGKPVVRWPLPAGSGEAAARQSVWLPDSRGCVTLVADAAGRPLRLVRHRFFPSGVGAAPALSLPVRTPPGAVAFAGAGWLRGVTGDGRYALVLDAASVTQRTRRGRRKNASLKLLLVPLVPGAPPPSAVALPEPALDNAIAAVPVVSPRGDCLAWLVTQWQPRVGGTDAPFAPPRMSLWVSRLPASAGPRQATTPRSLGTVSLGPQGRRPRGLQWSPDGKRLSFLYGDALWAVPAGEDAR